MHCSNLAGIAFSNSALGIVHGLAHSFGATYNIPHGLANAIILPYGIEFNSQDEQTNKKYIDLAKSINVDNLKEAIDELKNQMQIPNTMSEVISEKTFEQAFETLVSKVLTDVCTPTTNKFDRITKILFIGYSLLFINYCNYELFRLMCVF